MKTTTWEVYTLVVALVAYGFVMRQWHPPFWPLLGLPLGWWYTSVLNRGA